MTDRRSFLAGLSAYTVGAVASSSAPSFATRLNGQSELDLGFDPGYRYEHGLSRVPIGSLISDTVKNATRAAIYAYRKIELQGGWPMVPDHLTYRLGMSDEHVASLRSRLLISGDLKQRHGLSHVFDTYVADAVVRFQDRHGLARDGTVGLKTLRALNVPTSRRLHELQVNYASLLDYEGVTGHRSIVVNIPAARLDAVEGETVVARHATVVGKRERQSPLIRASVNGVNFNPYWTIPKSIIRRDVIPLVARDPDYLSRNRLRISHWDSDEEIDPSSIDWGSDEATAYRFRQDPFEGNSLGGVRINMPNNHAVYMHDTPDKTLFGAQERFHSSGCVRVQRVYDLVDWLLENESGWSRARIREVARASERVDARLGREVPVLWVYFTAWAESDGTVNFRDDVYDLYRGLIPGGFTPFTG